MTPNPRAQQDEPLRPEVPENLKVFRIKAVSDANAARLAWENACIPCGSERLAIVYRQAGDHLYVLASPVEDLRPGTWCPFAAVLPTSAPGVTSAFAFGTPSRQSILLLSPDGDPKLFSGLPSRLAQVAGDYGVELQTLDANQLSSPVPWTIQSLDEEAFVRAFGEMVIRRSIQLAGCAIAVVALCGAISAIAGLAAGNASETATRRASQVVEEARVIGVNDVAAQLGLLDDVDRQVLQLGGMLEGFRFERGAAAAWRARFPKSVTADAIEKLGGRSDSVRADGGIVAVSR